MRDFVFVTGNQGKADYLAARLGLPIRHQKVVLTDIQSIDLHDVVFDKAQRAFKILKKPVLVEGAALDFDAIWVNCPVLSSSGFLRNSVMMDCVDWWTDWRHARQRHIAHTATLMASSSTTLIG